MPHRRCAGTISSPGRRQRLLLVASHPEEREAEVARLVRLGARPVRTEDGGTVVLADPDGSELVLLQSLEAAP